jgi:hypothetical protein
MRIEGFLPHFFFRKAGTRTASSVDYCKLRLILALIWTAIAVAFDYLFIAKMPGYRGQYLRHNAGGQFGTA